MCREEAQEASSRAAEMKEAGASRVVCIVKEDIGTEIADFGKYWSEEVLMDSALSFFTAIGGGEQRRPTGLLGLIAGALNRNSRTRASYQRASDRGVTGNITTGEGLIAGGVYVVKQDGKAAYAFQEEQMGDHAPVDDVIEAVKAAARGENYTNAPQSVGGIEACRGCRRSWKEWAGRTDGPDGYVGGDLTRGMLRSASKLKKEK